MLPPKDIPQALREDDWLPGLVHNSTFSIHRTNKAFLSKESTTKTVSTLLDTQPRWLRPKNREQMDQRIAGLSECKAKRKGRRKLLQPEEYGENRPRASDAIPSTEFTETPLDDLLAFAPEERFSSNVSYLMGVRNSVRYAVATAYQGIPYQDEQVLPSSTWQDSPTSEQTFNPTSPDANMLPSIDQRSLLTYVSTSSLKRRLPRYSTQYLKGINRLLESLSISGTSAATITGSTCSMVINEKDRSSHSSRTILALPGINGSSRNATLLLPNAFLRIDHYIRIQGICIPGLRSHDSQSCWCAVVDELSRSKFWVGEAGLVMGMADPPTSLRNIDLDFRDAFGNNVLHLLAVRGAHFHVIMQAMEQVNDVNAKNTASQSFLHVLECGFFRSLVEDETNLIDVLQHLNRFKVRFHDCDVFGRSFFHILTHQAESLQKNVVKALSCLNAKLPYARDAFGWTPISGRDYNKFFPTFPKQPICHLPTLPEDGGPPSAIASKSDSHLGPNNEALISKHARLLETARLAFELPSIEDSEGRNSLHCLAEASLSMSISNDTIQPSSSHKRKHDQRHIIQAVSSPMTLRYELVQNMLSVGVDINSYDLQGNTVLMAFVAHLCDGEDDKTLAKLLHHLAHKGANLHWRNRQGETALHIAVRLGRKIATRVLLEDGANVHARTTEGKGVLAVGEIHYLKARDDQQLYASIMACMALAIQFGAVAAPTVVQEWSTWWVGGLI